MTNLTLWGYGLQSPLQFGWEMRDGWPRCATSPETIMEVHNMVFEDHCMKLQEIVEAIGISSEWVYHIFTDELGMKKYLLDGCSDY